MCLLCVLVIYFYFTSFIPLVFFYFSCLFFLYPFYFGIYIFFFFFSVLKVLLSPSKSTSFELKVLCLNAEMSDKATLKAVFEPFNSI